MFVGGRLGSIADGFCRARGGLFNGGIGGLNGSILGGDIPRLKRYNRRLLGSWPAFTNYAHNLSDPQKEIHLSGNQTVAVVPTLPFLV